MADERTRSPSVNQNGHIVQTCGGFSVENLWFSQMPWTESKRSIIDFVVKIEAKVPD